MIGVWLRRQPSDYRMGKFAIGDLTGLHWGYLSGGVGVRSGQPYIYGYVPCDKKLEGELAHSCKHGEGPHSIKVCVLKIDNPPEVYNRLVEVAGEKPKSRPSCRQDAFKIIKEAGEIRGPDLRHRLEALGHGKMTIDRMLPNMERKGEIVSRKEGVAKIYRIG